MLTHFELVRLALPLTTPYHLSFGDVHAFDTVIVRVRDADGREGLGEATVLNGYTDEEIGSTWTAARELADASCGKSPSQAAALARALGGARPFLATAFTTALEMLQGSRWLAMDSDLRVPLLGTINDTEPGAMRAQIDRLCLQGYRTLKIKVGLDPASDAARIRAAARHAGGRARLRVDANQGFTPEQAIAFAAEVPPEGIELFEQPCKAGDWDAHMKVAANCPLPLMLDESIYTEDDIDRAARLGAARFVKVKLMKFVSLDRLAAAIERIRSHGIEPVLGNGVAADLGCWMEACVAARHIGNAGELNGWTKMRRPLLRDTPKVQGGAMVVPAGWKPVLDEDAVEAATVDHYACSTACARPHAAVAAAPH